MLLWLFTQLVSKDRNCSSVVLLLPNCYFTIVPCFSVDLLSWLVCIWELQFSVTSAFTCLNSAGARMWESSCARFSFIVEKLHIYHSKIRADLLFSLSAYVINT